MKKSNVGFEILTVFAKG